MSESRTDADSWFAAQILVEVRVRKRGLETGMSDARIRWKKKKLRNQSPTCCKYRAATLCSDLETKWTYWRPPVNNNFISALPPPPRIENQNATAKTVPLVYMRCHGTIQTRPFVNLKVCSATCRVSQFYQSDREKNRVGPESRKKATEKKIGKNWKKKIWKQNLEKIWKKFGKNFGKILKKILIKLF